MTRILFAFAICASALCAPRVAFANDEPDPFPKPPVDRPLTTWHPVYQPETSTADLVATGAGAATALTFAIASPQPKHWVGGILFDDSARNALRLHSLDARYTVRDASDVGLSLAVTWPFLVDGLVTAWYYRGEPEIARRMVLVDAEVFALAGAVQEAATSFASRQRPYAATCGTGLPDKSVDCDGTVKYRSFFSGHSTLSFAGAGLVCSQHMSLGLLGAPGDILSCVGAYAVAATTATFRVMGDMHYASDVITGALVGSAFGIGLPLLRRSRNDDRDVPQSDLHIRVMAVGSGLGVGGTF